MGTLPSTTMATAKVPQILRDKEDDGKDDVYT